MDQQLFGNGTYETTLPSVRCSQDLRNRVDTIALALKLKPGALIRAVMALVVGVGDENVAEVEEIVRNGLALYGRKEGK